MRVVVLRTEEKGWSAERQGQRSSQVPIPLLEEGHTIRRWRWDGQQSFANGTGGRNKPAVIGIKRRVKISSVTFVRNILSVARTIHTVRFRTLPYSAPDLRGTVANQITNLLWGAGGRGRDNIPFPESGDTKAHERNA